MRSTSHLTRGAILLYHRVGRPARDVYGLCVSPQAFRQQMACLAERYRPTPLGELAAAAQDRSIPPGAVAVTFDDGYIDNYEVASPILREFGVPATFFLTTDRLEHAYEYWWDTLDRVLLGAASLPNELSLNLPEGPRTFPVRSDRERSVALRVIHSSVMTASPSERQALIDRIVAWSGNEDLVDQASRRMTAAEVIELADREGHDIGAHSVRHLMLPRQSAAVQLDEVARSRRDLHTLLGRNVDAFAYPFGGVDHDTVTAVRSAAFKTAVTTEAGPVCDDADPLRLPRLEVRHESDAPFDDWLSLQMCAVQ